MGDGLVVAKPKLIKLKIRKNFLTGKILLDDIKGNVTIKKLMFVHRNSLENEKQSFPVFVKKKGAKYHIIFNIDITNSSWKPFYWDAYIGVEINNLLHFFRVKISNDKLKFKMNALPFLNSICLNQDYHIFPYITSYGSFSLTYKKRMYYESKKYMLKWLLAFLIYLFLKPYWDYKKIWLGFEKHANVAQDNGFTFFRYCYEKQKHNNFYYVIRNNSPDIPNFKGMEDKLVFFMSLKYMIYFFASKLLISSESKGHLYDIRIQNGFFRRVLNRKKNIFLQHGVIGLKRVDNIFHKNSNNRADLFITSSDFEKKIIVTNFGYQNDEVEVTGLSRWDNLQNNIYTQKILVMPTWRSWMDDITDEEFVKTDYYLRYSKLIQSSELKELIQQFDLTITFYLHHKFKKHLSLFKSVIEQIKVNCYGDSPLQKEIMESSLMITDYSSVAWDMFYLKKPVVFYQFDKEEYLKNQGSYLDFPKDLFGDQALDLMSLIILIKGYASNGFREKKKYSINREKYFKYIDHKNSERIFNTIKKHFPYYLSQFKSKN
ncbi:hypothetical protein E2K98_08910 [Bacillus salipaludis]|uniref:Uncharacterized protein n=1 Tax=Bacillus salipaludis TaxID=2547811 RepID=A0A4R5VVG3_9BACI|nr:CDP-glycerol glycerophosphotransferase family protein [Bacillus salipaludis]TDK62174.1 hypothetical protein E2K98_08910 [Bacillus salipaludis]